MRTRIPHTRLTETIDDTRRSFDAGAAAPLNSAYSHTHKHTSDRTKVERNTASMFTEVG